MPLDELSASAGETALSYPSVADWVQRLGLRRQGGEFKGPCPICGGVDRFHVKQGRIRVMAGCRQCQAHIKDLHSATFGNFKFQRPEPDNRHLIQKLDELGAAKRMRQFAEQLHAGLRLTPNGYSWARTRGLDPKRLAEKGWRSIETSQLPQPPKGIHWPSLPLNWDAIILMPVEDQEGLHSYRLRPIGGQRIAFMKTMTFKGAKASLYNEYRASLCKDTKTLHVAEGETDTESILEAGAKAVVGVPGCASLHDQVVKFTLHRHNKVVIWFDADDAGISAAVRLGAKLETKRRLVLSIPWRQLGLSPSIQDANDILRHSPSLLAQMVNELS